MITAPLPINEPQRIAALRDYGILDTPEEPDFDDITALAAAICGTPIALISLVDETRQWFKSKVGVSIAETSRDVAFCAHAILGNEILIVPDALEDPRFAQNPLVAADPKIRFYAGAPLVSEDGLNIGTLCVIDHEPRELTEIQRHALLVLSRQVVAQMRLRWELRALQASEAERNDTTETQAAILDALPANIALIDSAGVIIAVNESWRLFADANGSHLGGSFLGDNYISVCESATGPHSEEALAVACALRKLLAGGISSYEIEYPCHSPGEQRWFRLMVTPLREDLHMGAVVMHVNITEQKKAEEKLREHATLLNKAQDAIVVRDLDHRILFWNLSAERLYGWTASEAIGQSAADLLHPSPEKFTAAAAAVLEKGEWLGELEQTTCSGKLITVEARWTLVRDDHGLPKSILTINTDITDRKRLEQQFLRAQRMESIGTLAGGIAHDLNNVLAPIMMSIDILKQSITDPRSLEILALIGTSARRGADMVGQVLSFARGMEGRRIRIELQPLIQDLVKIAKDTFPKNILIRSEIEAQLWPLDADPTQIHQVLINLCVNARDAMPEGGHLIIRASNADIDAHYAAMHMEAQVGKHLCIEVEDTGTGMTPETINSIFDPFFTTKGIGAGTGLGLSTALAIVKGHGGFVCVYSDPGAGSRFRFYLPAADVTAATSDLETSPILPRGQGEIVLVVDDEASIRQITRQTLEAFGYSVLVAADGAEAVSTFVENREHIAVVLTDMMMPITDGPSLIKILRRLDPAVRIIGASGIASNFQIACSQQAGVRHFLAKPYTAETLLVTIRAILTEDPAAAHAGNHLI